MLKISNSMGLKLGAVAFFAGLSAQSQAMGPITMGLKAGLPFSAYTQKDNAGTSVDTNFKMGYMGGVGLDVSVGPIGIEGDLLYARRTYGYANDSQSQVSRLELPVTAHLTFGGMFNVQGGLYYAMGLGKLAQKIGGVDQPDVDFGTAGYERSDFGMVGGLGVTIPAGITSVGIEARYLFGLRDQTAGAGSARHRSFDILASVWF